MSRLSVLCLSTSPYPERRLKHLRLQPISATLLFSSGLFTLLVALVAPNALARSPSGRVVAAPTVSHQCGQTEAGMVMK